MPALRTKGEPKMAGVCVSGNGKSPRAETACSANPTSAGSDLSLACQAGRIADAGDLLHRWVALDGPFYELTRCGWAFVARDGNGKVVAAAYGRRRLGLETSGGRRAGRCCRR